MSIMLLEIQQIIYMIKYNLKRRLQSGIGRDYRPFSAGIRFQLNQALIINCIDYGFAFLNCFNKFRLNPLIINCRQKSNLDNHNREEIRY